MLKMYIDSKTTEQSKGMKISIVIYKDISYVSGSRGAACNAGRAFSGATAVSLFS